MNDNFIDDNFLYMFETNQNVRIDVRFIDLLYTTTTMQCIFLNVITYFIISIYYSSLKAGRGH